VTAPLGSGLWEVIGLTLRVTGTALALSALVGVPAGAALAFSRFPGRGLLVTLVYTGMGFPPVVVGLAVYLLLSRSGPAGSLEWLFTPYAMIVAQCIIALPLIAGLTQTAIESIDPELRLQISSMGASRRQQISTLVLEARQGVIASLVAGFGGIISEVGAAMLVGGNIEGSTRVLSTDIILQTRQGNFALALALGGVLLAITFGVNVVLLRLQGPALWRRS
jgi:tungstate transport system permease protein